MNLPDLLILSCEEEYKDYFIREYCNKSPIATFDGLPVMFYSEVFEHAFYKRTCPRWTAPKDCMDIERCKRMPWIKAVLNDNSIIPMHTAEPSGRFCGRKWPRSGASGRVL